MTSRYQIYQRTIEGFLAALDRLGEQQSGRSSTPTPAKTRKTSQPDQPIPVLTEQETQMLAEAVADIEQNMNQQRNLP